jgi:hypothetical protein
MHFQNRASLLSMFEGVQRLPLYKGFQIAQDIPEMRRKHEKH